MSDSMVIKDLKDAYYMHSGLAFSADETYDLWAEFDARDRRVTELEEAILERGIEMGKSYRRITELEAYIDQLIEVSEKMFTAVIAAADPYDEGMREWDKIVNDWKEG